MSLDFVQLAWLAPALAAVAFVYGSVGLGGGSSYVALLALTTLDHRVAPIVALGLNTLVAASGTWHFARAGHLDRRLLAWLAAASLPTTFFASRIPLTRETYQLVLGCLLLVAAALLASANPRPTLASSHEHRPARRTTATLLVALGAALGVTAGITGIGGGIYLIPILVGSGMADAKRAAAIAAPFILLNSLAGLAGRADHVHLVPWETTLVLAACATAAGLVGAHRGARLFTLATVQRLAAALVGVVGLRLVVGRLLSAAD